MRILHVNDVASVGSILVRASRGRDALLQPHLRRDLPAGKLGGLAFAGLRLFDAWEVARRFRSGEFTHLHVHYATFAVLAELASVPYSLHVHGADVWLDPGGGGLKARLAIRGIERARKIAVSTPDLLPSVRAMRPDVIWIPNPMELPPLPDPPPRRRDRPRLIMLSKMDYLKGWDRQLEVVERLARVFGKFSLSFFTHGQLPDAERSRLEARLVALGGEVMARKPRQEFLAALASYDFAIGQMEVGALGMSEMEAMAAALPVVADASEHARAGIPLRVIAPEDAEAQLPRLWASAEARRAAGLAGREDIATHHDPQRSLALLENQIS